VERLAAAYMCTAGSYTTELSQFTVSLCHDKLVQALTQKKSLAITGERSVKNSIHCVAASKKQTCVRLYKGWDEGLYNAVTQCM